MESEANKERSPHIPRDKKTSSSSDDNQQDSSQGESQARPYECTFCKRGFSNAQALGGHMNIHRKDKAKLKQAMAPTTTSNKSINDDERSINVVYAWPPWNIHHAEKECSSASRDRPIGESKQTPSLFVHDKQMSEDPIPISSSSVIGTDQDLSSRSHDSSSDSELDLELRLGPDPPPPDSPTGTKKFF
ncbi:hypothetical protein ACFE04_014445 [Oxalis oulophora]